MPNPPTAAARTYADFWQWHGRQSFWLTRHFSYRLGAVLALLASRLGISPHTLTGLSFLTGVGGCFAVALWPGLPLPVAGVLLFVFLHLSYGLDCADGVLARATGQSSRTGGLMDKTADLLGAMIIPGILGVAAFRSQEAGPAWFFAPFLIWWSTLPRLVLTVMGWIRDGLTPEMDRKGQEDSRERNMVWRMKKLAGNLNDDVTYRTGIAISWGLGQYWNFIIAFQAFCFLLLVLYLIMGFKDTAAADRRAEQEKQS